MVPTLLDVIAGALAVTELSCPLADAVILVLGPPAVVEPVLITVDNALVRVRVTLAVAQKDCAKEIVSNPLESVCIEGWTAKAR